MVLVCWIDLLELRCHVFIVTNIALELSTLSVNLFTKPEIGELDNKIFCEHATFGAYVSVSTLLAV